MLHDSGRCIFHTIANRYPAVAFAYFETLLRLGDRDRIAAEEARLKSLNNLLNSVGFQEHLYEDFVDATITLLREISASIPCHDDGATLWASFNDPDVSNGIITHFRVSTPQGASIGPLS